MLQTKASEQASSWANKKKEAMERARQIREAKKFGIEQPETQEREPEEQQYKQHTAQKKFQHAYSMNDEQLSQTPDQFYARSNKPKYTYNPSDRPPSSEELAQARHSLRLLKSKKKNQNAFLDENETKTVKRGLSYGFDDREYNQGDIDDAYDDVCDEMPVDYNNKPIKNQYNSNNKFGGSLPAIDQNTNTNYRKVFKPDLNSNTNATVGGTNQYQQQQQNQNQQQSHLDTSLDLNFEMKRGKTNAIGGGGYNPSGAGPSTKENLSYKPYTASRPPLTKYNDQSYNSGYDDEISTTFTSGQSRTSTTGSKARGNYGTKPTTTKETRAQTSVINSRSSKPNSHATNASTSSEYDPLNHDNFVVGGSGSYGGYGQEQSSKSNKYGLSSATASTSVNKVRSNSNSRQQPGKMSTKSTNPYSKENIDTDARYAQTQAGKKSSMGGGSGYTNTKSRGIGSSTAYGGSGEEAKYGNSKYDNISFDDQPINSSYSQSQAKIQ